MTFFEEAITIGVCAAATILTRFLPFFVFSSRRPTPPFMTYLGKGPAARHFCHALRLLPAPYHHSCFALRTARIMCVSRHRFPAAQKAQHDAFHGRWNGLLHGAD